METKELLRRQAQLESENDMLRTELEYLDQLMRQAGFSDGLATVKATALELIESAQNQDDKAA